MNVVRKRACVAHFQNDDGCGEQNEKPLRPYAQFPNDVCGHGSGERSEKIARLCACFQNDVYGNGYWELHGKSVRELLCVRF